MWSIFTIEQPNRYQNFNIEAISAASIQLFIVLKFEILWVHYIIIFCVMSLSRVFIIDKM